ncbi:MAG: hypothetical protein QOH17_1245 [Pseudonocardiales bacterium]|nr:hypothetical protein [Pseudonocardiales bacterium]
MSEFATVGLTVEPSLWVKPARVAGSPVALECELHARSIARIPHGEWPGHYSPPTA